MQYPFVPANRLRIFTLACALSSLCSAVCAQTPSAPGTLRAQPQPAPHAQPASPPAAATPSGAAAAPATITLANGKLSVSAQNSDLNSILQEIAHTSGMAIDGLGKSTRVFGVYGPGNPRDVLADLLAGSGYNFLLLGGDNGNAPTRLVLTAQSAAPPAPANAATASGESDDAGSDDADQEQLGPGAIPHPSPRALDMSDPQIRAQRNLERLEQMRQQMQEQQEEQEQDDPQ
jgi:hypothetical protein